MLTAQHVTYYPPFTHYLVADVFRLALLIAAVGTAACVLFIAHLRWSEDRRSAALFLLALTLSMGVHVGASVVGLGRPPTWWLLVLRALVIVATTVALTVVVGEARRGVWARR